MACLVFAGKEQGVALRRVDFRVIRRRNAAQYESICFDPLQCIYGSHGHHIFTTCSTCAVTHHSSTPDFNEEVSCQLLDVRHSGPVREKLAHVTCCSFVGQDRAADPTARAPPPRVHILPRQLRPPKGDVIRQGCVPQRAQAGDARGVRLVPPSFQQRQVS